VEWYGDRVRERVVALAARRQQAVGARAEAIAKQRAPYRSGDLRESIGHRVVESPSGPVLVLYVGVSYGAYQEARSHYLESGLNAAVSLGWPGATRVQFLNLDPSIPRPRGRR
jgi:hypothetical protein